MKMKFYLLFIGLIVGSGPLFSQEEFNQTDKEGRRHGVWKKYYPDSKQLRYEGKFVHGKEVGEFRFYCETCKDQPNAVLKYKERDPLVEVRYFSEKGKLISQGKLKDQIREGEWIFYHPNSDQVMTREFYVNGKLNGRVTTYYPNGKKTEETDYKNGIREGENNFYSEEGVKIKELLYKNGELHGPGKYFDGHGQVIIEGNYKDGRKHGLWKYYENGKVILEEKYPKEYQDRK